MNSYDWMSADELGAYALALRLAAAAFYLPPRESFLAALNDGAVLADWPLAPDDPLTVQGLQLLREALAGGAPALLLSTLRSEHTALFVGLEHVAAPPWESVYLSRDHLLFDEQTLAVREFYTRFDLQIPKIDREPDDHIGFELLFLAHLLEQAAGLAAGGQPQGAQARLQAAQEFLQAHPQQWADHFAGRILAQTPAPYYRGWACLLMGSLQGLAAVLARADAPAAAVAPKADGAAA